PYMRACWRAFLPAYPDVAGRSAPIRESGYKGACGARVGRRRRAMPTFFLLVGANIREIAL
ncbi:MAG: hypothetical protein WCG52_06040, partial [bacterium]